MENFWFKTKHRDSESEPLFGGIHEPQDGNLEIGENGIEICEPINGQWSEWSNPPDDECKEGKYLK